ncbi:MAG: transcriptional repressor [Hyphomonas sp.]|nr:transcriptional repressor [Hyphomonas sp.]MCB9961174.1 transcriptional repressor [Hyphomonas sp.]MCB9970465.1 transcriptional repressor [Hyphomonas sp.]
MTDFDATRFLDAYGLRATRPRTMIAHILFADGRDRHVTAEWLSDEVGRRGEPVALATIYNTLHSLVEAGALREVRGAAPGTIVFDTNAHPHHHFFDETTGELTDIPAGALSLSGLPEAPADKTVAGYDIVIRVR